MSNVEGVPALQRRLRAIGDTRGMLKVLQLAAVQEAKALVPRKTGNLGRSIAPGFLSSDKALVVARANYAAFVELGTRPHDIVPRRARVLRFAASPGGRRLSGRPRKGAAVVFAKRVHHPGTKPYPYLLPGAQRAVGKAGLSARIIKKWNDAA